MQFHVVRPKYVHIVVVVMKVQVVRKGHWEAGDQKRQTWQFYPGMSLLYSAMRHDFKTSPNIRNIFPKRRNGNSINYRDRKTLTHIAAASPTSWRAVCGSDSNSPLLWVV